VGIVYLDRISTCSRTSICCISINGDDSYCWIGNGIYCNRVLNEKLLGRVKIDIFYIKYVYVRHGELFFINNFGILSCS
jgi:hypothetical protein